MAQMIGDSIVFPHPGMPSTITNRLASSSFRTTLGEADIEFLSGVCVSFFEITDFTFLDAICLVFIGFRIL